MDITHGFCETEPQAAGAVRHCRHGRRRAPVTRARMRAGPSFTYSRQQRAGLLAVPLARRRGGSGARRCARARAARRPRCSRSTSSACTSALPRRSAGASRCPEPLRAARRLGSLSCKAGVRAPLLNAEPQRLLCPGRLCIPTRSHLAPQARRGAVGRHAHRAGRAWREAPSINPTLALADPGRRRPQVLELAESGAGGCKLASAAVGGRGAYGRLKFESGIHRVQRVPATESSGRVHTSAASVAVMPQATEVRPERAPLGPCSGAGCCAEHYVRWAFHTAQDARNTCQRRTRRGRSVTAHARHALRAGTHTLPGCFHGPVLRMSSQRCPAGARGRPGGCRGARRGPAQTHSHRSLRPNLTLTLPCGRNHTLTPAEVKPARAARPGGRGGARRGPAHRHLPRGRRRRAAREHYEQRRARDAPAQRTGARASRSRMPMPWRADRPGALCARAGEPGCCCRRVPGL